MKNNAATYQFTISAKGVSKHFIANINDLQLESLKNNSITNYDFEIRALKDIVNAGSYQELRAWLKDTKLSTIKYHLTSVDTKVIELPEGVKFNNGYIEVSIVDEFKSHTHETALKEVRLMEWVLKTFPTSTYGNSRNKFVLNISSEMTLSEDKVTGHTVTITPSDDQYIEVTTRTFIKKEIEL
jgi:hypothetical protein